MDKHSTRNASVCYHKCYKYHYGQLSVWIITKLKINDKT